MGTFKSQRLASALVARHWRLPSLDWLLSPCRRRPTATTLPRPPSWACTKVASGPDDALRAGMTDIRTLAEPQLGATHAGKPSQAKRSKPHSPAISTIPVSNRSLAPTETMKEQTMIFTIPAQHASPEGEVMCPAAIRVGHHLRLLQGQRPDHRRVA